MSAAFTPAGLTFDEPTHRYTLDGHPLLSVTTVLRNASLVDLMFYTDEARERGTRVHAAIALLHEHPTYDPGDASIAPYLHAYRAFLADSAFRVDAVEERLADAALGVAGTLDVRGEFPSHNGRNYADSSFHHPPLFSGRVDVIDVKTGAAPPWVGYQTAGYVRMLPSAAREVARRWCLQLGDDGRYRLVPLTKRTDEYVFLAALTIARAKRGWS